MGNEYDKGYKDAEDKYTSIKERRTAFRANVFEYICSADVGGRVCGQPLDIDATGKGCILHTPPPRSRGVALPIIV